MDAYRSGDSVEVSTLYTHGTPGWQPAVVIRAGERLIVVRTRDAEGRPLEDYYQPKDVRPGQPRWRPY